MASNREEWPEAIDAEDVKIAEVTLSNGDKLGWYEVAPGVTLTGLKVTAGSAPQTDYSEEDARTLSPAEVFDKIVARAPQEADPDARAALSASVERTRVLVESMKGMEKFRDRGAEVQSRSGSPSETGDVRETQQDNRWVDVGAASYRGSINYRVRVNTWAWETPVSANLSAGNGWIWGKTNFDFDFDVESKVTSASGDGYHHCGAGWY